MEAADVSVVIPYFEAADSIDRCLASVASQSVPAHEVIVVDDGSAEPLALGARPIGDATSLVTVRLERNVGAAAARNEGVRRATGKYIAFLDADDVWLDEKLRIQYAMMERGGWTLSGHRYEFAAAREQNESTPGLPPARGVRRIEFAFTNPFFTPTVMVRREGFTMFDEAFRRADDYKAWLENFAPGRTFFIEHVLAHGFKPPLGHSGLTGSVGAMHGAYLDVLGSLYAEGKTSLAFHALATVVEQIKFPLRRARLRVPSRTRHA